MLFISPSLKHLSNIVFTAFSGVFSINKLLLLIPFLALGLSTQQSQAQTLLEYDIGAIQGFSGSAIPHSFTAPNVSATPITYSANLQPDVGFWEDLDRGVFLVNWNDGPFDLGNNYFEFTVSAENGNVLRLTQLTLGIGREAQDNDNLSGPEVFRLYSDIDGFSSPLHEQSLPEAGGSKPGINQATMTVPLGVAFEGIETVTFRLYAHENVIEGTFPPGSGLANFHTTGLTGSGSIETYFGTADILDGVGSNVILTGEVFSPDELTLTKTSISDLAETSVTFNASIPSDGGTTITSRGFVFAETTVNSMPAIGGTGVTNVPSGSGVGSFSEAVSGLTEIRSYTVRSYVTTVEQGTEYSDPVTFATLAPELVRYDIANIDGFSATQLAASHIATGMTAGNVVYASNLNIDTFFWEHLRGGIFLVDWEESQNMNNSYFEFEIAPEANHKMTLNNLTIGVGREESSIGGSGPAIFRLYSSIDGWTNTENHIAEIILDDAPGRLMRQEVLSVLLDNTFEDIDIPVTFRLYGFSGIDPGSDPAIFPGGGLSNVTGTQSITDGAGQSSDVTYFGNGSDVIVSGTVTAIEAPPSVSTTGSTINSSSSITFEGNVTDSNNNHVTERGIIFSATETDAQLADVNGTTVFLLNETGLAGDGSGVFNLQATGLEPDTPYHFRAYAINGLGTTYGATLTASTNPIPAVTGITLSDANPSNASEVHFEVEFNVPVHLDGTLVSVNIVDLNGVSITNVAPGIASYGTTHTITVSTGDPAQNGSISIDIPQNAATDQSGEQLGMASGESGAYIINKTIPVVTSIERASGIENPTNQTPFNVIITFSEPVTGFDITGLDVTNATATNLVANDGDEIFTVEITPNDPASDVLIDIGVPAAMVQDPAGNPNPADDENFSIRFDGVIPDILSLSGPALNATNQTPFDVNVTFSEPVTLNDIALITLDKAVLNQITPAGTSDSFTFSVVDADPAEGDVFDITLQLLQGAFTDDAGNESDASSPLVVTYDVTPLTTTISSDESPGPTNAASFDAAITFNKPAYGFDVGDVVVSNASLSNFTGTDGDALFTVTVTPDADGEVTLDLAADVAEDAAGNNNMAAVQFHIVSDQTAPVTTVSTTADTHTNTSPIAFEIGFNEPVPAFSAAMAEASVSAVNATGFSIQNFSTTDDQTYTFDLVPGADDTYIIKVAAGTVEDPAGNENLESNEISVTLDTTPPVASLSTNTGNPTNETNFILTVDFGEEVTGFDVSGLVVNPSLTDATLTDFTVLDQANGIFTVLITPQDEGLVEITIAEAVADDLAGNLNPEAVFSVTADYTDPEVIDIQPEPGIGPAYTNASQFNIIITFSEVIADFDETELVINNASATGFTTTDDISFAVTLAADPVTTSSNTITVDIPVNTFTDPAGNTNPALANPFEIEFGDTRPTAEFTTTFSDPTSNSPVRVTLSITEIFGEPVSGFDLNDITSTNVENIVIVEDHNPEFVLDVTSDGAGPFEISLILNEGAVTDPAGNTNEASPVFSIHFDSRPLRVDISSPESSPTNADPIPATITFNKPVWGFEPSDITISQNATFSTPFFGADGDSEYHIVIHPPPGAGPETITLNIAAGAAQDATGDDNAAADEFVIVFDQTSPSIVDLYARHPATETAVFDYINLPEFDLVIAFSKEIADFDETELLIDNATATGFSSNDNTTFVVSIEADPVTTSSNTITVNIPADTFSDLAGNTNPALANPFEIEFGDTRPTAVFTTAFSDPTPDSPIRVTLSITEHFGEPINGFDVADITTANVQDITMVANNNPEFVLDVIPNGAGPFEISLVLNEGAITDIAGNENEISPVFTINFDASPPQVVITSTASSPANTAFIPVTVTFSKPVWGFGAGDITYSNASGSSFQGNDGDAVYSVNVTPFADGTVSLSIPADVATDVLGNSSSASTLFEMTFDQTPPEILSIVAEAGITTPTNESEFDVIITFSEEIADFDVNSLVIDNATATEFSSNDNITFVVSLAANPVTTSSKMITMVIPEAVFTDPAGNTNLPAPDMFSIEFSNLRPSVLLTSDVADLFNQSPFEFTVSITERFGRPVNPISPSDFTTVNVASLDILEDNNTEVVLEATPSGEGEIRIRLNEHAVSDAAGNTSSQSNTLVRTFDTTTPAVEITTNETSPSNAAEIYLTIRFDKPVWLFSEEDILLSNAVIFSDSFTGTDGDSDYQITIQPVEDGPIVVDIPEGAASDEAGNANTSGRFSIASDRTAPTVLDITAVEGTGDPTTISPIDIQIAFSEALASFESDRLEVENADIQQVNTDDQIVFTATLAPLSDGIIRLHVPAETGYDHAGNSNEADNLDFTISYFETPSVVDLISPIDDAFDIPIRPNFLWDELSRAGMYELQMATDSDFSSNGIVIEILDITESGYTVQEDLDYNHNYYWRVRANNEGFTGAWSAVWSFLTLPEAPPPVSLVSPVDREQDLILDPAFSWDQAARAVSYHFQVSASDAFDGTLIYDETLTETGFTVEAPLTHGQTLYWRVRAENSGGLGDWSDVWAFSTRPAPPDRVVLLAPEDSTGSVPLNPELSWIESDRAYMYQLEIAEDRDFHTMTDMATDLSGTSWHIDETLDPYGHYFWRVRAENSGGVGEWSETRYFVTKARTPELIFPLSMAQNISIAPQLSWRSLHSGSTFEVQIHDESEWEDPLMSVVADSSRFQAGGLNAHTNYHWRVRLNDPLTKSDWSPVRSFTTRPNPEPEDVTVPIVFERAEPDRIESQDYQMIGLPGVQQVYLDDILGSEYEETWRAFFDDGSEEDYLKEFDLETNRFLFGPGRGYWVLHRESFQVELDVNPVDVGEDDHYPVAIHSGWNIISNPFLYPVEWEEILFFNDIDGPLYQYDQIFSMSDTLHAFKGYYFYNHPDWDLDQLIVPYTDLESRRDADENEKIRVAFKNKRHEDGRIGLRARFGETDSHNSIMADVSWNYQPNYKESPYPNLDMSRYGVAFTSDDQTVFSRSIGSIYDEAGSEYELTVKAPVGKKLTWEAEIVGLSPNARILLLNPASLQSRLLDNGQSAELTVTEPRITWTVFIGDELYLQEILDRQLPAEITLRNNYPNPFNPSTNITYALTEDMEVTLDVFDILGRRVQTLVQGHQNKGWHSVTFDGSRLASGVYIYRLVAGDQMLTQKMMLIK